MSTAPQYNASNNVQAAITAGNGFSESTVDGQLTKAITNVTAHTAVDSVESAAFTLALTILNNAQAHLRSPSTKGA